MIAALGAREQIGSFRLVYERARARWALRLGWCVFDELLSGARSPFEHGVCYPAWNIPYLEWAPLKEIDPGRTRSHLVHHRRAVCDMSRRGELEQDNRSVGRDEGMAAGGVRGLDRHIALCRSHSAGS